MSEKLYPPKNEDLAIVPAKKQAGGPGAVWSSLKNLWQRKAFVRGMEASLKVNQKQGFDCPGCAWPDPDGERSLVEFCENGIKALAEETTSRKIGSEFFKKWSVQELKKEDDFWLGEQGRLSEPLYKPAHQDHYQPISWLEAFDLAGQKLKRLSDPDKAIFYTSGRTSNEAAFLYQLFVRKFGTNNLPDCSNMCHESSGVGLGESIGIGKGTVTLEDFEKAEVIVLMGQNPGTNHPRMLATLQKAVRRGAKIISINPLREAGSERFAHPQEAMGLLGSGTSLTHLFLPIKINGDVAFLKGLQKLAMQESDLYLDREFIEQKTLGFAEFANNLENATWEEIELSSGLSKAQIQQAAALLLPAKKTIFCWAMGLTQHKNGVSNIQEVVNYLLLRGQLGIEGAGVCPVRGHSNVQGDRTMGIVEKPKPEFIQSLKEHFKFDPPKSPGANVVESIDKMYNTPGLVFVSMGGNFVSASPDTEFTAQALENCDLTVHISTKLNRSHLYCGKESLILPCLGRSEVDLQVSGEQKVSVENSMGIVHSSQGKLKPISSALKSEVAIVCGLAKASLGEDWSDYEADYSMIRKDIQKVIPGFQDYNERLESPSGFYLPNGVRDNQSFHTRQDKALFTLHKIEPISLQEGQLIMMTIRTHDQFNTTIYGLNDRYRGVYSGRRVVLMNSSDMKKRNLATGDLVNLVSRYEDMERRAEGFKVIPYEIPPDCVATYFPETNSLIPLKHHARKSHTPASKSVVVKVEKY